MMVFPSAPSRMEAGPWFDKKRTGYILLFVTFVYCYILNFLKAEDPFAVPFCEADGICYEKPEKPSPRTVYSARTKSQYDRWWSYDEALNRKAKHYAEKRKNYNGNIRPLILLGDSITESWEGTGLGQQNPRTDGIPQVLREKFSDRFDPIVLAISGDQTQHLLYRMEKGQLPSTNDDTAIYVVMIGTNNLGSGELPGPTAKGVLAVANYILENTKGRLLLFKILPRGDTSTLQNLCPPRCKSNGSPFHSFLPAIERVNKAVSMAVEDLKETYGVARFDLLDCGEKFLSTDPSEGEVDPNLMPDFLHPNAEGHVILADCILEYIKEDS